MLTTPLTNRSPAKQSHGMFSQSINNVPKTKTNKIVGMVTYSFSIEQR